MFVFTRPEPLPWWARLLGLKQKRRTVVVPFKGWRIMRRGRRIFSVPDRWMIR